MNIMLINELTQIQINDARKEIISELEKEYPTLPTVEKLTLTEMRFQSMVFLRLAESVNKLGAIAKLKDKPKP